MKKMLLSALVCLMGLSAQAVDMDWRTEPNLESAELQAKVYFDFSRRYSSCYEKISKFLGVAIL